MLKFDCRYRLVGGDECQGFDNPVGKIDILHLTHGKHCVLVKYG